MQIINFMARYGWIALLPVCLVSFIPLALSADMVGGIPNWAYWTLSMFLTLALVAWSVTGACLSLFRSRSRAAGKESHAVPGFSHVVYAAKI